MAVDPELASELRRAASKIKDWTEKRDSLIVQARTQGTLREIAELVGLTHAGVRQIVKKAAAIEAAKGTSI